MFGAGCFWGVEYNFSKLDGVKEVLSGSSGGETPNPTYEQVCNNSTEHAEVVLIEFDESVISYQELLDSFWDKHFGSGYKIHDMDAKYTAGRGTSTIDVKEVLVTNFKNNIDKE